MPSDRPESGHLHNRVSISIAWTINSMSVARFTLDFIGFKVFAVYVVRLIATQINRRFVRIV